MLKEHPIFKSVSSLKLTTLLLYCSMVLIFFGTLDQTQYGIRRVQALYFQGFITIWDYPDSWLFGKYIGWIGIPIPGGYLIGPLIILNLVTAHFRYFRLKLTNIGLIFIHFGLLLLLLGQGVADLLQEDYYMWLDEGNSSDHAQSFQQDELVIIHSSPEAQTDRIISIPSSFLKNQTFIAHAKLPFRIKVLAYYPNSVVRKVTSTSPIHNSNLISTPTAGVGMSMQLRPESIPLTRRDDERNLPSAIIEIITDEGSLGRWLVNTAFENRIPDQHFEYREQNYQISLRIRRKYFPFSLKLTDFEHKRYPGSDIPKAFTCWVELTDHETGEVRESKIYMNHPLRYGGYTFYQASFNEQGNASMFQIVSNPGRHIPYIALTMVTIGLLFQFGMSMSVFLKRRFAS